MTVPVITIDGPSGAGKGTVARRLAARLGWHFLDSGALYRVAGLIARQQCIPADDEACLAVAARDMAVEFRPEGDAEPVILLNGEDVSADVRSETAGQAASGIAAIRAVRDALLERQRAFRHEPGLVADGRDMGTRVFPDAPLKVFLTATADERARRRHKQLKDKGVDVSLAALSEEIAERDERDRNRTVQPLEPAPDAVIVDTTMLGIDEVVDLVMRFATEVIGVDTGFDAAEGQT